MEWIDVRDNLPESDGEYLCCIGYAERTICRYTASNKAWVRRYDSPALPVWVTHWMELPPCPKNEKK